MSSTTFVSVSEIEPATGIGSELLRKWRERYGFPALMLDGEGRKGLSGEQVEQLRLIRRLLDTGLRPGQVVGRSLPELLRLASAMAPAGDADAQSRITREALRLLTANDRAGLAKLLKRERAKLGLTRFARDIAAPLASALGDAWARGEIEVYQEHLCTTLLMNQLTTDVHALRPRRGFPRVLFATPSEELHLLGLLMAQAVLGDAGADCISLGQNVPVRDIAHAAANLRVDILAVSMSFAYPRYRVHPFIAELRAQLPSRVEIWIGGAGAGGVKRAPRGVRVFDDLAAPVDALLDRV